MTRAFNVERKQTTAFDLLNRALAIARTGAAAVSSNTLPRYATIRHHWPVYRARQ
jgi:hypothetical protein